MIICILKRTSLCIIVSAPSIICFLTLLAFVTMKSIKQDVIVSLLFS